MNLGTIDFDDRILDALRDGRLVVFAGAGVSMGPPSNLPSFWRLACEIAKGTDIQPGEHEPLDRFLGKLLHSSVNIYERAAQLVSPAGSVPNTLHQDLLRMFGTAERVRIVTTNYDLHFEAAAEHLFGKVPDVYRAPALPRGNDFSGIVHVHGAIQQSRDLVLADADFGRAYLTEGWARRFLVNVFSQYTVLFVGYSHDDVVMNYLSRALPAERIAGRFALTDEDGKWDLLGIRPVLFVKDGGSDKFKELYDGVHRLAEHAMRGALDWQSRLAELGCRAPPTDDEAIGEIEYALREVYTTRFLLDVASDPEWIGWFEARKYLDRLFDSAKLGERDYLLAQWLSKFAANHSAEEVLNIAVSHENRLSQELWIAIGYELARVRDEGLAKETLKRWLSILLTSVPDLEVCHILMQLAECCAGQGCIELTLRLFMVLSDHRVKVKHSFARYTEDGIEERRLEVGFPLRADHWSLNEVWTKYLKPHLPEVAQPLISSVTRRLEEMHDELRAWDNASRDRDPISLGRAAIEQHPQDQFPAAIDVLIDAARDTIEWMGANSPLQFGAWIELLVASDVPLLRRLAIHGISLHPEWSPDERLRWLLKRVGIHTASERHEVRRLVALSYALATDFAREAVVDAVLAHTVPAFRDWHADKETDLSHFEWLSWLLRAKPDCAFAIAALAPIIGRYPNWRPSDHADSWIGEVRWIKSESPWSVEQLLAREPREQLEDLLSFQGKHFEGPSRDGLLTDCREACKRRAIWAFALAQELADRGAWSSDLWSALLRGLQESDLSLEDWRDLLVIVSNPDLHPQFAYDIANLLEALVRDGGKPFALDLLEQANAIALPLWLASGVRVQEEKVDDWLSRAINRPAGVIVEFWISGLSLLIRGRTAGERVMPENYRNWFALVLGDSTSRGGMGRTLLASQAAFLFSLDAEWTSKNIIPLFSDPDPQVFRQAWDGFLKWGRLNPELADVLLPAIVAAMPRLASDVERGRERFVKLYTELAIFYVSDPTEQLLPVLFRHGALEDRLVFASHIRFFLSKMGEAARQKLWQGWLHRYWQNRRHGVPTMLDTAEIRIMLEWLPHLGDEFPDAVDLATQFPVNQIEHRPVLYRLRESDLVTRYPVKTAELLIYLANCGVVRDRDALLEIYARLPPLPAEIRRKIEEAFAHAGVLRARTRSSPADESAEAAPN